MCRRQAAKYVDEQLVVFNLFLTTQPSHANLAETTTLITGSHQPLLILPNGLTASITFYMDNTVTSQALKFLLCFS